ncbi:helix-turn-helix domain-containing protein [Photobacterium sp. J15]|uniref:helix-turn-helix domain-containing protein n=1 Tax=Photobacterium sp. J15 TaxID=265901 RepID=UPI000A05C9B2|nr:helix-turn-helix transcriptional regulator [Photobacterium sp. J15]
MMNKLNDCPITSTLSLIPYLKCLSEAGFDATKILKHHKLDSNIVQQYNYIPSYIAYEVLKSISKKIGSENIGIDAYKIVKLPTFIANIKNLMESTDNIVEFFTLLSKNQHLIGSHFKIWLEVENNILFVCHQGSLSNSMPFTNQAEYFRTLSIIEIVRFYTGNDWKPLELHFNSMNSPPIDIIINTQARRVFVNQQYAKIPIIENFKQEAISPQIGIFNFSIESKIIDRLKLVTNTFIDHEDLSLSLISDLFGCSNRTLQRVLKKDGVNFRDFIKQQKLEHAISLLHDNTPISDIAHRLGYKDPANFTRSFKSYYGVAPSLFREPTNFKSPK